MLGSETGAVNKARVARGRKRWLQSHYSGECRSWRDPVELACTGASGPDLCIPTSLSHWVQASLGGGMVLGKALLEGGSIEDPHAPSSWRMRVRSQVCVKVCVQRAGTHSRQLQ